MVSPWVQGQREFRKKGIKKCGRQEERMGLLPHLTAGGAENPPRAATVSKSIRNCFTCRHDSMFAMYAVM